MVTIGQTARRCRPGGKPSRVRHRIEAVKGLQVPANAAVVATGLPFNYRDSPSDLPSSSATRP